MKNNTNMSSTCPRSVSILLIFFMVAMLIPPAVYAADRQTSRDASSQQDRSQNSSSGAKAVAADGAAASSAPVANVAFDPFKTDVHSPEYVLDNNTGAFTFSYPIVVPPGRNEQTPTISLQYNSQELLADSLVGRGWSLSVPTITRTPKHGIDETFFETTDFTSSLSGELRGNTGNVQFGTYSPHLSEGPALTYEYVDDYSWIATDTFGNTYYFGTTASSRIEHPQPGKEHLISQWAIDKLVDANGNSIAYSYTEEDGYLYIDTISYTHHDGVDAQFQIVFEKEERPDTPRNLRHTFFRQVNHRIARIETRAQGEWVRRYDLSYSNDGDTNASYLIGITESAKRVDGTVDVLPSATFSYAALSNEWESDSFNAADGYLPLEFADMNGDGFVDMLHNKSGTIKTRYWNELNGAWSSAYDASQNTAYALHEGPTRLTDINGDQKSELVTITEEENNVVSVQSPFASWVGAQVSGQAFETFLLDVNGDGLSDLVRRHYFDKLYKRSVFYGNGDGTFSDEIDRNAPYTQNKGLFGDINGDGLVDYFSVAFLENGTIHVNSYLNNGKNWEWNGLSAFTSAEEQLFGSLNDTRAVDVNGDGFVDIAQGYYSGGQDHIVVFLNRADGTGWFDEATYTFPGAKMLDVWGMDNHVRFVDIDANGVMDMVRSQSGNANTPGTVFSSTVQKSTSDIPGLLTEVSLHTGATYAMTYAPVQGLVQDGELLNAATPGRHIVVTDIAQTDGVSASWTTSYSYADGFFYHDGEDKKLFAGFGIIQETDPSGFVTKKYFHQGNGNTEEVGETNDTYEKIGQIFRTERYDDAGNLFQRTRTQWESIDVAFDQFQIQKISVLTQTFDGNADSFDIGVSYVYDEVGNEVERIEYGQVEENADGSFADVDDVFRHTQTWYVSAPFASLVKKVTKKNALGEPQSKIKYYYDGLAHGEAEKGNVTHIQQWTGEPDASGVVAWTQESYQYDMFGNQTSVIDADGHKTKTLYDEYGLYPQQIENALGHVQTFLYDYGTGQVVSRTTANGLTDLLSYDGFGRQLALQRNIGENGAFETIQTFSYVDDVTPRSVVQTAYFDDDIEQSTVTYLDAYNRTVQVRTEGIDSYRVIDTAYVPGSSLQSKRTLPYVDSGNAFSEFSTNTDLTFFFAYDPLKRAHSATHVFGNTQTLFNQGVVTTLDVLGNQKDFVYDGFDQLQKVREHNDGDVYETMYEYDALGNLLRIVDANGHERLMTYDPLQRRLSQNETHAVSFLGDVPTYQYVYSDYGDLLEVFDPNGDVISYTYDALHRVTEEYVNDVPYWVYTYDNCENGVGELCSAARADGSVETLYTYTTEGRVASKAQIIGDVSGALSYTYDLGGNVKEITYPNGYIVRYDRNAIGEIAGVSEKLTDASVFSEIVTDIVYGPAGEVVEETFANGLVSTYSYDEDALYLLKNKTTVHPEKEIILEDVEYTYDAGGNIVSVQKISGGLSIAQESVMVPSGDINGDGETTVVDVQCGIVTNLWMLGGMQGDAPACTQGAYQELDLDCSEVVDVVDVQLLISRSFGQPLSFEIDEDGDGVHDACDASADVSIEIDSETTYVYDDLYRLLTINHADAASDDSFSEAYTYNPVGNILSSGAVSYFYDPGLPNRVVATDDVVYGYDNNGNVISVDAPDQETVSYSYTHKNELHAVTHGQNETTHVYTHESQRAQKDVNGVQTQYFDTLYEYSPQHTSLRVFAEGRPISVRSNDFLAFQHTDHLGSIVSETGSNGALVRSSVYEPFGGFLSHAVAPTYANARGFLGETYDSDAQLHYLNARYYDSRLKRFLSVDPVVLSVGSDTTVLLKNPQTLNPYSYATNNPVVLQDQTGEFAHVAISMLAGGIVNVGVDIIVAANTGQSMDLGSYFGAFAEGAVSGLSISTGGAVGVALKVGQGVAGYAAGHVVESVISEDVDIRDVDVREAIESGIMQTVPTKHIPILDHVPEGPVRDSVKQFGESVIEQGQSGAIGVVYEGLTNEYAKDTAPHLLQPKSGLMSPLYPTPFDTFVLPTEPQFTGAFPFPTSF